MPILIPGEQISILLEAFRKILLIKALKNFRIRGIGLTNKFRRRVVIVFFLPVNCYLSFGELKPFVSFVFHKLRLPPLPKNMDLEASVWLTAEALRARPSTRLRMRGYEEFRSW